MKYLSVCSGIEAATVAWHPLGWEPIAFSEIDAFPSAVLAHHYPNTPNLGDMTNFKDWPDANVDVLVGGTPCQSFSIAGLRKGLADPRGNLMLTYLAIADRYRPEWLVWENVPGVLSSNGGRDFGTFLGGLAELRYGFAYRILDAQYFGVAQRRRRVFVVANSRSWQRAAAVLFERHSLQGHPAPRRETWKDVAGTISPCLRARGNASHRLDSDAYIEWPAAVAPTLDAHYGDKMGLENQHINSGGGCSSTAMCLTTKVRIDAESETLIPTFGGHFSCLPINTQIATRHEALGEGTGFGVGDEGDPAFTLQSAHSHAVAFGIDEEQNAAEELMGCLKARTAGGGFEGSVMTKMQVRRLTPTECERLQGFPDGYTAIPYRGKPAEQCSDGPRYKALGNSMAVPVMRWLGERIAQVSTIKERSAA